LRTKPDGRLRAMALTSNLDEDRAADKLEGLQQIADYLHWSLGKTKKRMPLWKEAGILFIDYKRRPPQPHWCTFISLLQRWIILRTRAGLPV